jgi:hypothetical protein
LDLLCSIGRKRGGRKKKTLRTPFIMIALHGDVLKIVFGSTPSMRRADVLLNS